MAAPMPPPPAVKLSSVALTGIIVILVLMAGGVFAYVLFLAPLTTDQRLWWNGFVSIAFAFIAYLVYAGSEAQEIRYPPELLCSSRGGHRGHAREARLVRDPIDPRRCGPRWDLRDVPPRRADADPDV